MQCYVFHIPSGTAIFEPTILVVDDDPLLLFQSYKRGQEVISNKQAIFVT
jgi:hypothetical protein